MTNSIKISQLPAATIPLTGAEDVALVQDGVTKKTTLTDVFTQTTSLSPIFASGTFVPTGDFWTDVDGGPPSVLLLPDRIRGGQARSTTNNRVVGAGSVAWNGGDYPSYLPRDADFCVMSAVGSIAIAGLSQTSDNAGIAFPPATIGVAGAAVVDSTNGNGWGLYSDVTVVSATGWGVGVEFAIKNMSGVDTTSTPYAIVTSFTGQTFGCWFAGGSDAAYGAPTNPCDAAIALIKNASTWNTGIVFAKDSLTGTNGVTGTGVAMSLAKGHMLKWWEPSGTVGATINSAVATTGKATHLEFNDDYVVFRGNNNSPLVLFSYVASSVNFAQFVTSTTGNPVRVEANGTDTNIHLSLYGKGTGGVVVGGTTSNSLFAVRDASAIFVVNPFGAGSTVYMGTETNSNLAFVINNAEKFRMSTSGNLMINATVAGTGLAGGIVMYNGTAPSTSPANTGQLYVESGALKYRGSGGTITTLGAA
jgi:hypothetical protein